MPSLLQIKRGELRASNFPTFRGHCGRAFFHDYVRREHAHGIEIDCERGAFPCLEGLFDSLFDRRATIIGPAVIRRVLGVVGEKVSQRLGVRFGVGGLISAINWPLWRFSRASCRRNLVRKRPQAMRPREKKDDSFHRLKQIGRPTCVSCKPSVHWTKVQYVVCVPNQRKSVNLCQLAAGALTGKPFAQSATPNHLIKQVIPFTRSIRSTKCESMRATCNVLLPDWPSLSLVDVRAVRPSAPIATGRRSSANSKYEDPGGDSKNRCCLSAITALAPGSDQGVSFSILR